MSEKKPRLFSYYRSSCSYRVRIALNLKKVDFEYIPIHLINEGGEQNSDEYTQLNPMRQIPFYYDGQFGLAQSMAIIDYLDSQIPDPVLLPKRDDARAKVIELCEIINSGIQPLQNLGVMNKLKSDFGATNEQVNDWCMHWVEKGLAAYEKQIEKISGTYSVKHEITAADLFLIPQVYNANRFNVDMSKYPTIERVTANCLQEEAFMDASPQTQPDTPTDN